jgi:hypothetical protein
MDDLCSCGSNEYRYPLRDGYGIFLTYVCDKCVAEKRKEFREDIFEQYDADEPIDEE